MVRDKAYVCNFCRKVITYSPEQAGISRACPFCKSQVHLPPLTPVSAEAMASAQARRPSTSPIPILVFVMFAAAAGAAAFFVFRPPAAKAPQPEQVPITVTDFLKPRTAVAPAPVAVRWTHTQVAVTEAVYGCPDIFNATLKTREPCKTPVLALRIEVTNAGKKPSSFRTWRIFDALGDRRKAVLKTGAFEQPLSLVSFGVDTYPSGVFLGDQTAPGQTVTDIILFMCPQKPEQDLTLMLPCENVGGHEEDLIVTIPCAMIR